MTNFKSSFFIVQTEIHLNYNDLYVGCFDTIKSRLMRTNAITI